MSAEKERSKTGLLCRSFMRGTRRVAEKRREYGNHRGGSDTRWENLQGPAVLGWGYDGLLDSRIWQYEYQSASQFCFLFGKAKCCGCCGRLALWMCANYSTRCSGVNNASR